MDRTVTGDCNLIEQMQSSVFTFTDNDGGTLDAVQIVSVPTIGFLKTGTRIISAGDIVDATDLAAGLYYHTDDTITEAYSEEFYFRVKTVEVGVYSDLGKMTINTTLCTNSIPIANNNTTAVDRTITASCLVSQEYTDASIFTFSDADGDAINAIKVMSLPLDGDITIGLQTPLAVGDIIEFPLVESLYYHTSTSITDAYDAVLGYQVRTDGIGVFSNTATLTFNVSLCSNINELPVASPNTVSIDRLTTETCEMIELYTEAIFTYNDTEFDDLNAIKIVSLPTNGTLTWGPTGVINAGDILPFNISWEDPLYYRTNAEVYQAYTDTIEFQVRTNQNTEFSNTSTVSINVSECVTPYQPCVDYEPHFNTFSGGVGLLNAGILQSDVAIVGEYVIE
jgi:hypothetical protein